MELVRLYSNSAKFGPTLTQALERAASEHRVESPAHRRQDQRRLSPAEQRKVLEAYEAGATIRGISREWGIDRETARGILRRSAPASRGGDHSTEGQGTDNIGSMDGASTRRSSSRGSIRSNAP